MVNSDLYTGQYEDALAALEENPPEERSARAVWTPELRMLVCMPVERETVLWGIKKKQSLLILLVHYLLRKPP